jgi:hypothetical protein
MTLALIRSADLAACPAWVPAPASPDIKCRGRGRGRGDDFRVGCMVGLRVHPCESVVKIRIKTGNGGDRFSGFAPHFSAIRGLISRRLRRFARNNSQAKAGRACTQFYRGLRKWLISSPSVGKSRIMSHYVGFEMALSCLGETRVLPGAAAQSTQVVDFPRIRMRKVVKGLTGATGSPNLPCDAVGPSGRRLRGFSTGRARGFRDRDRCATKNQTAIHKI